MKQPLSHPALLPRLLALLLLALALAPSLRAQDAKAPAGASSVIEDRKAKQMIEAGDARYDANEIEPAIELYKAAIDRYPASKWRYLAHLKIGKHAFLKDRKYDLALDQFRRVAAPENKDIDQVAEASLFIGRTLFENQKFEESFTALRDVIKNFPDTPYCNDAYFYIGQGHFKLGRFNRAIEAFKNVGTALGKDAAESDRLEIGKRLYIRIDDQDLTAMASTEGIKVTVETTAGDKEEVLCFSSTPGSPTLMGSIKTLLGDASQTNGVLELSGTDTLKVTYLDRQTAEGKLNFTRTREIRAVGQARAEVVDGAFTDPVGAVVLEKPAFLRVRDADRDITKKQDKLEAIVRIKRLDDSDATPAKSAQAATTPDPDEKPVPKFKVIQEKTVTLTEQILNPTNQSVHAEAFIGSILIAREGSTNSTDALRANVGDYLEIEYRDELNLSGKATNRFYLAKVIEGNLSPLQVAEANVADEELKVRIPLETTEALTKIGNIYKEMGLNAQAKDKYKQALDEVQRVARTHGTMNPRLLERTYVQTWKIYYAMDDLNRAAAQCVELQRRFPNSPFVGDALLLMAQVAQKKGNYMEAVGVFRRLAAIKSPLAAEAQFGIGAALEAAAEAQKQKSHLDEAFRAYKTCAEKFPASKFAGDALSRMADYYYNKEDYSRAIDIYEEAIKMNQDSKFLDNILYGYGRCLVKMKRLDQALEKFRTLILTYPNSPLAPKAKQIADAIEKKLAGGTAKAE